MPNPPTRRKSKPAQLSCGVLVTDGALLLLGHATRSPRWDIPKGLQEPGESPPDAARRELLEETGLSVPAEAMEALGSFAYLPGKDLALFTWRPLSLPDPATLRCSSVVVLPNGGSFPELDRFALFPWSEALEKVGKNMARVLACCGVSDRPSGSCGPRP